MMENDQEALHIEKKVFLKTIMDGLAASEIPPSVGAVIMTAMFNKFIKMSTIEIKELLIEIAKDVAEMEAKRNEQVN